MSAHVRKVSYLELIVLHSKDSCFKQVEYMFLTRRDG